MDYNEILKQLWALMELTRFPEGEERYLVIHAEAEIAGTAFDIDKSLLVLPLPYQGMVAMLQPLIDMVDKTDCEPGDHEYDVATKQRIEKRLNILGLKPKITLIGEGRGTVGIYTAAEIAEKFGGQV